MVENRNLAGATAPRTGKEGEAFQEEGWPKKRRSKEIRKGALHEVRDGGSTDVTPLNSGGDRDHAKGAASRPDEVKTRKGKNRRWRNDGGKRLFTSKGRRSLGFLKNIANHVLGAGEVQKTGPLHST